MPKRSAEAQSSREGWFEGAGPNPTFNMNTPGRKMSEVQKQRKIIQARSRRQHAATTPSSFAPQPAPFTSTNPSTLNSNQAPQQPSFSFGSTPQTGAMFGSSQNNINGNNQQSQSSFGGFGSGGGSSFNFAPTAGPFSFSAGSGNNPFSQTSTGNNPAPAPTPAFTGGSIFKPDTIPKLLNSTPSIKPSTPSLFSKPEDKDPPMFAPMPANIANGFSTPTTNSHPQQPALSFGQPPSTPCQSKTNGNHEDIDDAMRTSPDMHLSNGSTEPSKDSQLPQTSFTPTPIPKPTIPLVPFAVFKKQQKYRDWERAGPSLEMLDAFLANIPKPFANPFTPENVHLFSSEKTAAPPSGRKIAQPGKRFLNNGLSQSTSALGSALGSATETPKLSGSLFSGISNGTPEPLFSSQLLKPFPPKSQASTTSDSPSASKGNSLFGNLSTPNQSPEKPIEKPNLFSGFQPTISAGSAAQKTDVSTTQNLNAGTAASSNIFKPASTPSAPTFGILQKSPIKRAAQNTNTSNSFTANAPTTSASVHFSDAKKSELQPCYKLCVLDASFQKHIATLDAKVDDFEVVVKAYIQKRERLLGCPVPPEVAGAKRKSSEDANDSSKRVKPATPFSMNSTAQSPQKPLNASAPGPVSAPSPATISSSLQPTFTPGASTTNSAAFKLSQSALTSGNSTPKSVLGGKRKANDYLTKDGKETIDEEENIIKRSRTGPSVSYPSLSSGNDDKEESQTAKLFKGIVNNVNKPNLSPTKPSSNNDSGPRASPFKSIATNITEPPKSKGEPTKNLFGASQSTSNSFSGFKQASASTTKNSDNLFAIQPSSPEKNANIFTASPTPNVFAPNSPIKSPIKPSASPFTFKPSSSTDTAQASGIKPPTFAIPKFGSGGSSNFLSQFGQTAKKVDDLEKENQKKRKEADFDSDEETEEEWKKRDAAKQEAKRKEFEEASKKAAKFVPGKGFVMAGDDESMKTNKEEVKPATSNASPFSLSAPQSTVSSTSSLIACGPTTRSTMGGASVFDAHKLFNSTPRDTNIFGHLSDADSGAESSKVGDADDEDTGSAEEDLDTKESTQNSVSDPDSDESSAQQKQEQAIKEKAKKAIEKMQAPQTPSFGTRSLFDRIAKDENGDPVRTPPAEADTKSTSNIFSASVPIDLGPSMLKPKSSVQKPSFSSSAFGSSTLNSSLGSSTFGSSVGDHTWKVDSPIKFNTNFGGDKSGDAAKASTAPIFSFTSATPSKNSSNDEAINTPFSFSSATPTKTTSNLESTTPKAPVPFTNLFGASKSGNESEKSPSALDSPTAASAHNVGFSFGAPSKNGSSSLFVPSGATSHNTSRATSPGATDTGADSTADSAAEGADTNEGDKTQLDLTAKGAGEENEDTLMEVRSKPMRYIREGKHKGWEMMGLGICRLLKHKETGKARVLIRADPSGRVMLNCGLYAEFTYEHQAPKGVKLIVPTEDGSLESWVIKVGKDENAIKMVDILETNKGN